MRCTSCGVVCPDGKNFCEACGAWWPTQPREVPSVTVSPTRTRWLMVGLLFWLGVLMFIDRVNISIAAKYIMPEYGLTEVHMGWVFSAFVLGYAMLQIPGGWLGDRFGPRI